MRPPAHRRLSLQFERGIRRGYAAFMARREADREDLVREATAFVERIELARLEPREGDHIVVGFRRDGAMSIFFGADPVYQFNATGELRRAFRENQLFKAAGGRLASLRRLRQEGKVELLRRDLTDGEQKRFLMDMTTRLQAFAEQLGAGAFAVVGQIPPDVNVMERVNEWLSNHKCFSVARRPNV
jgi:hypothetical protein